MTSIYFGDAASGMSLRYKSGELKSKIETLSKEIGSGTVSSVREHTGGHIEDVAMIDRCSKNLEGYSLGIERLALVQKTAQISLKQVSGSLKSLRDDAIIFDTSSNQISKNALSEKSALALDRIVSALNVSVSGESVFSGTATDRAPLDNKGLIAAVRTHVLAAPPSQSLSESIDDFFLSGGGYHAHAYSGSTADRTFLVHDGHAATVGVRADDLEIRRALGAAIGVVIALDETISMSDAERKDAVFQSIARLSNANESVLSVSASLGIKQEELEIQKVSNRVQAEGLKLMKSEMLGIDRYKKISELRDAENRLNTVYAMTARMSRLSILEYIK